MEPFFRHELAAGHALVVMRLWTLCKRTKTTFVQRCAKVIAVALECIDTLINTGVTSR
jgi:hypothetical protein